MGIDNAALIKILNDHKGIIYKISSAYAKDVEDRKDLEQEIIIQVWKSLPKFRGNSKVSTWIYRVSLNVSIAHKRKSKNREKLNNPMDSLFVEPLSSPNSYEPNERSQQLKRFVNQLDKFNKAILLLFLDDYSYEEIADIIGITKSHVGVKINRIKQQLKNKFETQKTS